MTIYVDADACPVTEIVLEETTAQTIWLVHNRHHEITTERDNVRVKEVGDRSDAADHWIANRLEPEDLVITDDLGLAALAVSRNAYVLRFRGDRVSEENIDLKLAMREASHRERQKPDSRTSGPPAFDQKDRQQFRNNLRNLLKNQKSK